MDMSRGSNEPLGMPSGAEPDDAVIDRPPDIGTDERRMHARAYNHWVSLLDGRACPSIENLDPGSIADFGAHSVLLDFSKGGDDPAIRFLGHALREETGLDRSITHVAQVPGRSLLSRLTDQYPQILTSRSPIRFEAEFRSTRGNNTLYRGILMPFSSDEDTIDFVYGVINWKELVDAELQIRLNAEVEASRRAAPVWANPPRTAFGIAAGAPDRASLAGRLDLARESAAAARASDTRSRASLYRALGRAYDFLLAAEDHVDRYHELLADAGLTVQARAPMTPVVKLVFGGDYDKTRLTEFAAVLSHAKRSALPQGGLGSFLESAEGGIKGVVRAERALRRPAPRPDLFRQIAEELRSRTPLAHVAIDCDSEFVVLLARKGGGGLDIVARVDDNPFTERAIRKAAA